MSHQLSQADQEQYRRNGFFFPLRIFSAEEAADHREQLENLEAKHGPMHYRTKTLFVDEIGHRYSAESGHCWML